MKSRFFYGVFVGFIVASLFFFFFFKVARVETTTATPERRTAALQGYDEGGTGVSQDVYSAATYAYAGGYDNYTASPGGRDEYQYELAQYVNYDEYDGASVAYYNRVAYDGYVAAYSGYDSGVYQEGIA